MSQSKANLVKEIRQDQLLVLKDNTTQHNNEIVLLAREGLAFVSSCLCQFVGNQFMLQLSITLS